VRSEENPRCRAVVGADASVCPGGPVTEALGTDPLSAAKRSRREDEGSVPMAGGPACENSYRDALPWSVPMARGLPPRPIC
jgi:hypothetical protein